MTIGCEAIVREQLNTKNTYKKYIILYFDKTKINARVFALIIIKRWFVVFSTLNYHRQWRIFLAIHIYYVFMQKYLYRFRHQLTTVRS